MPVQAPCAYCAQTGKVSTDPMDPDAPLVDCPVCGGLGYIETP